MILCWWPITHHAWWHITRHAWWRVTHKSNFPVLEPLSAIHFAEIDFTQIWESWDGEILERQISVSAEGVLGDSHQLHILGSWFIWYINDKGQNRKCKQLRLRHKIYWLNGKYLDRKHLHSDINPHPHPHPVQEQEDPLPPGIGPPASRSSLLWAVRYLSLFIILSSSSSCITLSSYKQMPILPPPNHRCWLWWRRWCCHCCCCCRWWCQWRKHCHFAIEDVDERKDVDVAVHLTICFSTLYLPSCN